MKIPRIAAIPLALAFAAAACLALRLAWADYLFRSGEPESQRRAAGLAPMRAEYQAAIGAWRRAVEVNPYFSEGWNELGLAAEAAGRYDEAESHLLRAARVDQLYEPRWALANFYLRRQNAVEFRRWLRLAAERSNGDRSALFALALLSGRSVSQIAHEILPQEPGIQSEFVSYLTVRKDWDGAAQAAAGLDAAEPASRQSLLALCDRLLEAQNGEAAHAIWRRLEPENSGLLSNAEFGRKPLNRGFDWRLHWLNGVHTQWIAGRIRVELSGQQPESAVLLSQPVLLAAPGLYRLSYRYRTEGIEPGSGLQWRAQGADAAPSEHLSSEEGKSETMEIRVTRPGLVWLELVYRRAPGSSRQEGVIVLEGGIHLTPAS